MWINENVNENKRALVKKRKQNEWERATKKTDTSRIFGCSSFFFVGEKWREKNEEIPFSLNIFNRKIRGKREDTRMHAPNLAPKTQEIKYKRTHTKRRTGEEEENCHSAELGWRNLNAFGEVPSAKECGQKKNGIWKKWHDLAESNELG